MFGWIFRRDKVASFAPGRGWTTEVVGESQYQDNLYSLYRSHGGTGHDVKAIADLMPDNENPYDANAVAVHIGGRRVGYLNREMAAEYRSSIGAVSGQCGAKIVGGFLMGDGERASYGVKLNISWPPRFKIKS